MGETVPVAVVLREDLLRGPRREAVIREDLLYAAPHSNYQPNSWKTFYRKPQGNYLVLEKPRIWVQETTARPFRILVLACRMISRAQEILRGRHPGIRGADKNIQE